MQQSHSQPFLEEPNYDPSTFTSFGAPPPTEATGNSGATKRFGSIFGAVASAFRRSTDSSSSTSISKAQPPSENLNSNVVQADIKPAAGKQDDVKTDSFSSNSIDSSSSSSVTQRPHAGSKNVKAAPPKKLSSLFSKTPPVSIGLHAQWASDDACHHCYSCSLKFTTFLRRHHCRFCGRIFCNSCSSFRIPGRPFGATEGLRSCEVCYRETLRSLLENHYESLSEEMLQKIASLYAAVAGGSNVSKTVSSGSISQSYPSVPSTTVPTTVIQSSTPSVSPRVSLERQGSKKYGPQSQSGISTNLDDSASAVILDPLRHQPLERKMTMTETMVADYSCGSGDEDDLNVPLRKSEVMPQLSDLKEIFESAFRSDSGLKFETKRSFAKTVYHCFTGESLLKWLMIRDSELNSFQAAAIAKAMLDLDVIVPLHQSANKKVFALASYYHPGRAASFIPIPSEQTNSNLLSVNSANTRRSSSVTSSKSRNDSTSSTSKAIGPVKRSSAATGHAALSRNSSLGIAPGPAATKTNQTNVQLDAAVGESLQRNFLAKENPSETMPYRPSEIEAFIRRVYKIHLSRLCTHMLAVDELDADKWQGNILKIIFQVVRIVKPRPRDYRDALDIRRCVKIKKIYDSTMSAHFEYIDGLAFTKSLSSRLMKSSVPHPRIMLISTGLDFERDCQQLTTLDVLVHQEAEQMQRTVSQIASAKPTVLFCGGSIPTLACKHLVANDISAASFVKPHILEQIARYTGAAILPSVDSLSLPSVRLGNCRTFASFSVHMHSRLQKTFLCLSGCDPVGCTLIVRDACYSDLIKVKRILKQLITVAYDGLALAQYLVAIRAKPESFDLKPPYADAEMASSGLATTTKAVTAFDDDDGGVINSAKRRKNKHRKRLNSATSFSSFLGKAAKAAKTGMAKQIFLRESSDLSFAALDLSSNPCLKLATTTLDEAFALTTSGLLSHSPLVTLPNPVEKSKLFEESQSRIYFESSLFSLLASCYSLGQQSMTIKDPAPPMWLTKCKAKTYHPFFTTPLTGNYDSEQVQTLLAQFCRNGFLFEATASSDDNNNNSNGGPLAPVSKQPSVGETSEGSCNKNYYKKQLQAAEKCGAWIKPLSIHECQCLHVLTSTFSLDSQLSPYRHCDGPRLVSCPLHTRADLSLGAFLENQCFVPTTVCPRRGCGAPLVDHIRRFASNHARIEIVVRPLAQPITTILSLVNYIFPGEIIDTSSLITWSMCRICRAVTPFVQVSNDMWGMSLALFLHFKLYAVDFTCVPAMATDTAAMCHHPFGTNYMQFFAKDSLVAVIKACPISVNDIVIPSPTVALESNLATDISQRHDYLMAEHELLAQAISKHLDFVQEYLEHCRTSLLTAPASTGSSSKSAIVGSLNNAASADLMASSEAYLVDERKRFMANMTALEVAITDPAWNKASPACLVVKTTEQIAHELFQNIQRSWLDWNERLRNLVRFLRTQQSSLATPTLTKNSSTDHLADATPANQFTPMSMSAMTPSSPTTTTAPPTPLVGWNQQGADLYTSTDSVISCRDSQATGESSSDTLMVESSVGPVGRSSLPVPTSASKAKQVVLDLIADSELFKHQIFKTKLKLPLRMPLDPTHHYLFRNQNCLYPVTVYDNEPSSLLAFALATEEYGQRLQSYNNVVADAETAAAEPPGKTSPLPFLKRSWVSSKPLASPSTKTDEVDAGSYTASLEQQLSSSGANEQSDLIVDTIDDDSDNDNNDSATMLLLPPPTVADATKKDAEGDGGSVIEFGSTIDAVDTIYMSGVRPKIASRRPILDSARFIAPRSNPSSPKSSPGLARKNNTQQLGEQQLQPASQGVVASPATPSPRLLTPQPSTSSSANKFDSPDVGRTKEDQPAADPHIRITWNDAAVSKEASTKFSVIIYHAAVFAEIRSLLVERGDNDENSDVHSWLKTSFLRSLSRCVPWQVAGGKSGLRFFKTTDGRLILKQVSRDELKTIFKLAPDYASLISAAREQNRPSALVPILGAFQVSFENGTTGRSLKLDLIVMTNLFRSYNITDKFDLKGSERNRFVKPDVSFTNNASNQQTGLSSDGADRQTDETVLMDENLLIRSFQDPLYVHPHSKQLLLQAIAADTQFLVRKSVMDYSLLVGIDSSSHNLVVGIIDYLRTFTFDKKLEYVVKSTGLLGGQGKAPTVLYPNKYRDRFLSAMKHFFLDVPDHWLAYETHNLRLASQT